jgi:hypothetical protein
MHFLVIPKHKTKYMVSKLKFKNKLKNTCSFYLNVRTFSSSLQQPFILITCQSSHYSHLAIFPLFKVP